MNLNSKIEVYNVFQSMAAQEITNKLERKIAQIICKKASTTGIRYTMKKS